MGKPVRQQKLTGPQRKCLTFFCKQEGPGFRQVFVGENDPLIGKAHALRVFAALHEQGYIGPSKFSQTGHPTWYGITKKGAELLASMPTTTYHHDKRRGWSTW